MKSRIKSLHANTLQKMISSLGKQQTILPNLSGSIRASGASGVSPNSIAEMGPYMYGRKYPLVQPSLHQGSRSPTSQQNPIDNDSISSPRVGVAVEYHAAAGEENFAVNNIILNTPYYTLNNAKKGNAEALQHDFHQSDGTDE